MDGHRRNERKRVRNLTEKVGKEEMESKFVIYAKIKITSICDLCKDKDTKKKIRMIRMNQR